MGPMEDSQEGELLLSRLSESTKAISELSDCRNVCKKMYGNLVRRAKLLSPLFEELRDSEEGLDDDVVKAFESLRLGLDSATQLLNSVNGGSKLYLALQREKIAQKFHLVTEQIGAALSKIHYDKLNLSEEVREQIELVHAQFQRAKGRIDTLDLQLDIDLATAQKEKEPDPAVLKRLSEKLHLKTVNDIKKESLAFHEMVISSNGDPGDCFEKMSSLFKKIKDWVQTENPQVETSEGEKGLIKHRSPVIPDDFRCPISLELMKDPVIVSTGQTYERSCIQNGLMQDIKPVLRHSRHCCTQP
uniref:RING-type E3 ubiquitin transferase n=1 Tax=Quercus lobata TaxID=97700 RepID=A0A7N2MDE3_QUELO